MRQADETLALIRGLWRDLSRNPFAEAEEHGITGPQITVISCLVSRGPMTVTEISTALGMSHSTASGIVDRLQARDLLRRSRDSADRRRTTIAVTDSVSRYVRELEAGPSARLAEALSAATAGQRRAIKGGLETLRALLDTSSGRATRPGPAASRGRRLRR